MAAGYSTTTYPYDTVAYIVVTYPDGESFQGSGVIIGPHTVLTASHLLWDATNNEAAASVTVYPGYNAGGQPITGQWIEHYNQIDDAGGKETEATSQSDFAVIDFAASLSAYGAMTVATGVAGGQVHMTGYPGTAGGEQTDQVGLVEASRYYSTLDFESVSPSPGSSGGPLWVDAGTAGTPEPEVVGLVSTSDWGVQLTSADLATLDSWETADSYIWTGASTVLQASQAQAALSGGARNDTLFGGAGNDSIIGGAGFNQINGNQGADTIVGHSTVGDWLLGGQGQDSIDASASTGANVVNGDLGADTLVGGSGADTLRGGQGDDLIHAGSGNAWISGDLGNNTIYGGPGRDSFHAGAGHDAVNGWHAGDQVLVASGVTSVVTQVNADVHIVFSNGGEMDLLGVQQSSLQAGWIVTS